MMNLFVLDEPVPATTPRIPGMKAWIVPMDATEHQVFRARVARSVKGLGDDAKAEAFEETVKDSMQQQKVTLAKHIDRIEGVPMPDGSKRDFAHKDVEPFLVQNKPHRISPEFFAILLSMVVDGPQNVVSEAQGKESASES